MSMERKKQKDYITRLSSFQSCSNDGYGHTSEYWCIFNADSDILAYHLAMMFAKTGRSSNRQVLSQDSYRLESLLCVNPLKKVYDSRKRNEDPKDITSSSTPKDLIELFSKTKFVRMEDIQ